VRHHLVIDIATIEKGGNYLGMVSSIPPEDLFTRWRSDYEADVMVSLASLAGEKMFFDGDSSSGVSGDLESATQLAILMEGYWGMGRSIASHGVTHRVGIGGGGQPGAGEKDKERDLLKSTLAARIEGKLDELFKRTEAMIRQNRLEILAVTHALEAHKTLTGEDIEAVIEGRQGPLIDGRGYHEPAFLAQANKYHTAVLAAHEEHGKVDLALPTLNGHAEPREPVAVAAALPAPRAAKKPRVAKKSATAKRVGNGRTVNGRTTNGRNGGTKGNGRKR
jgi:cell division protease FtsH